MGKRGPAPQPTALKLLRGNPGKRAINHAEPQPIEGVPECPDFLDDDARTEWYRVAGELKRLNLLTHVDRAALTQYCAYWSIVAQASAKIKEKGEDALIQVTGESGYEAPAGWFTIMNKASEMMLKYLKEFGLTPSSRTNIQVPQDKAKDAFEDFLDSKAS